MNNFKQTGFPVRNWIPFLDKWDVYISYIGLFESSGDFLWDQVSQMFCMHFIQDGKGIFNANGKKYTAKGGDIFIFRPDDHVIYYDSPETPWKYLWARLEGKHVAEALSASGLSPKKPLTTISKYGKIESLLLETATDYSSGVYSDLLPMTAAWKFLELISVSCSGASEKPASRRNIADSCRSILENRINPAISVDELSSLMKMNRSTLFRSFMKHYGISPKHYIDNLRLDKAAGLLKRSNLSIKEIAEASGFSNPSHFTMIFKKRFGRTPAKWKR